MDYRPESGSTSLGSLTGGRRERLSSLWTPFQKFVFPVIWILMMGSFVYTMMGSGVSDDFPTGLVVAVATLLTAFIVWYAGTLRKVELDDDHLVISDYFREERVPLRSITEVKCWRWSKGKEITVRFDHETSMGSKVVFQPKMEFRIGWGEHSIADELRGMVREQKYFKGGDRWVDRQRPVTGGDHKL